ncbi:SDR family NAD(P)-dependent oxidoreductase [Demequina mangrovi]|uniref:NAD(P)-dependent dehydrogenase, short-chain alcohol dehydrogenase family n=1 Tax=Demequina mangrovi TaxID=1043493 RepID=A0A1H6UNF4_9MICO|nr:SDR family oxidoreductase [Demequina mangrovi]SEI93808.1 NAD(P)-dependent dehydrogenase, short-chain alcohol dehydrogenase family [Demequina mangrovi]
MSAATKPPSSYEDPVVARHSLDGRRVLVVGGSSGFGRQVALDCALAGADVIVVGLDSAKSHATAQEAGALSRTKASALAIDVSDQRGRDTLVEAIGEVDHVVSTLGGRLGDGDSPDEDAIREVVRRKVEQNRLLVDAVAPQVRDGGSFVLTAGATRRPGEADGHGVVEGNDEIQALVRQKAVLLAPRLRVNAVAPTWTQTPLWRHRSDADVVRMREEMEAQIPLGRTADIREVARAYLFLMTSDFITGQTIAVDGGYSLT